MAAVIFDASQLLEDDAPTCPCHRHNLSMVDFLEALVRVAYALVHQPTATQKSDEDASTASTRKAKGHARKRSGMSSSDKKHNSVDAVQSRTERELQLDPEYAQVGCMVVTSGGCDTVFHIW